jgi:hypothetical protein
MRCQELEGNQENAEKIILRLVQELKFLICDKIKVKLSLCFN